MQALPSDPTSPSIFRSSLHCLPALPAIGVGIGKGLDSTYDSDDDEDISEALLEEEGGNFPRARKRHIATLRWRRHHRIDDILNAGETPIPAAFAQILRIWSRWLQGRTRDGDVLYEELGKLRGSSLREARLKPAVWARHMALVCKYVVQCVDQSDVSSQGFDEYDDDDNEYDDASSMGEGGLSSLEEGGVQWVEDLEEEEEDKKTTTKQP